MAADLQVARRPLMDARQMTLRKHKQKRHQQQQQLQHRQALIVPSSPASAAVPSDNRFRKTSSTEAAAIPIINSSKFKLSRNSTIARAVPPPVSPRYCSKQVQDIQASPHHAQKLNSPNTWTRRTTTTGQHKLSSDQPPLQLCRFWLRGCCSRGPQCNFLHSHPTLTPSTATNSRRITNSSTGHHDHSGPASSSCAAALHRRPAAHTTHHRGLTAAGLVEEEPSRRLNRGNDDDPIMAEAAEIPADDQSNWDLDTAAAAPDDRQSTDHLQGHADPDHQQLQSIVHPVSSLQHEQHQPLRGIALPGPGFNCLYTASCDGTLHIWDSATGAHIGAVPHLQGTARNSRSSSSTNADHHSSSGAGLALLRPFFACEWIFLGVPGEVQAWHVSSCTSTYTHVCTQFDVDRKVTLSFRRDPSAACDDDDQHHDAVHSLCVMPRGLVLAGTQDGTIVIWRFDPSTASSSAQAAPLLPWARLTGHTTPVSALESTAADQSVIFSASADGVIRAWDMSNIEGGQYRCLCTLQGHVGPVTGLLSLDRDYLFSSSFDGTIKLWKWSSSTPPIHCTTASPHLVAVDVHMDGQGTDHQLLMLQLQHTICPSPHVVDPSKSPPAASAAGHEVLALAGFIDVDDVHVLVCACGGAANTVHLFELPSFKERAVLPSRSPVTALEVGPGGLLFCGDQQGEVRIWRWKN